MRDLLRGYYPPSDSDISSLWAGGLFVLDASTLLDLYRYPDEARDDTFRVLQHFAEQNRLWVPFQVALEFQANRPNEIVRQLARFDKVRDAIDESVAQLDELELLKRPVEKSYVEVINGLKGAAQKIAALLKSVQEKHVQVFGADDIRSRLDELLNERTGAPPENQAYLDAIYADGKARYAVQIPPGFLDQKKAAAPPLRYSGLTFERQYGDLIVWKQILEHVKTKKITHVAFVTSDQKEDWWWRVAGKTLGPHPILVEEIGRLAGAQVFHMYTMEGLLKQASTYVQLGIKDQTIREVEEVSARQAALRASDVGDFLQANATIGTAPVSSHEDIWREFRQPAHESVRGWLNERHPDGEIVDELFPDFVVLDNVEGVMRRGYEVKLAHATRNSLYIERLVRPALERGEELLARGELDEFYMVIVFPHSAPHILGPRGLDPWMRRLSRLLNASHATGFILGTFTPHGFHVFHHLER